MSDPGVMEGTDARLCSCGHRHTVDPSIYEELRAELYRIHDDEGEGHDAQIPAFSDRTCRTCNLLVRAYGWTR